MSDSHLSLIVLVSIVCLGQQALSADGQATIDSVVVKSAANVTSDHKPIGATGKFSSGVNKIYITFKSNRPNGYQTHNISFDLYSEEEGRIISSGAWLRLPFGASHSMSLERSRLRLEPGGYRLMLKAGGSNAPLRFEIQSKYARAIRLQNESSELVELDDGGSINVSGFNIALAALGGTIQGYSSQYDEYNWSIQRLIDGLGPVRQPGPDNNCWLCGWSSAEDDSKKEVVVGFNEQRRADIAGIVLNTEVHRWTDNNDYTNFFPKHVEILVSDEASGQRFRSVAKATLRREPARQLIPLPKDTRAARVMLRVLETYGARGVVLGELEVLEATPRDKSIVADAEINLASPSLGSGVISFTSYDERFPASLFDGDRSTYWRSSDRYFPQDFTIGFANDRSVHVGKVMLSMPADVDRAAWPSEIAVSVSDIHPLDGFREIDRFRIAADALTQEFVVDTSARFVKLRILNNNGGKYTVASELEIIEGTRAGYRSVILRPAINDEAFAGQSQRDAEKGDEFIDIASETEPNDDLDRANPLAANRTTAGVIDPLGELDVFELPSLESDARAITLNYSGRPNIRHSLSLLDSSGDVLSHFDPGDLPASDAKLTLGLEGGERYLRLSEPVASVVVLWDTSGSMRGRTEDLERAVRAYVRNAPETQRINLASFGEQSVRVLLNDFTNDKTRLQAASRNQFKSEGATPFYDGIAKSIDLLKGREGNKAIIVMSDGADTSSRLRQSDFWKRMETNRIRLYTIGLGDDMQRYAVDTATTGERQITHLALATDGESFFSTESAALRSFYDRIARELSEPARYFIEPQIEYGSGYFEIVATGEQMPKAAMPAVHIVFDASGSMRERAADGRLKIDVAKEALGVALDGLPDGAPLAFTVYGNEIPEKVGKEQACEDTVTLQDFAPLNKKNLLDLTAPINAGKGGTTPIARSLSKVAASFRGESANGGVIILVTDGIEECDQDPIATIAELRRDDLAVIPINVIGFALGEETAKSMMKQIADIGGGQFYDAADGRSVASALREAMAATFDLLDASGKIVASGSVDAGRVDVPPGYYTVEIAAANTPIISREVRIENDHLTTMSINKVGDEVDVAISIPESLEVLNAAYVACGELSRELPEDGLVGRIQEKLSALGYDPGPIDNVMGGRTREAIIAFEQTNGLKVQNGLPSATLERHLDCAIGLRDQYLPERLEAFLTGE